MQEPHKDELSAWRYLDVTRYVVASLKERLSILKDELAFGLALGALRPEVDMALRVGQMQEIQAILETYFGEE